MTEMLRKISSTQPLSSDLNERSLFEEHFTLYDELTDITQ